MNRRSFLAAAAALPVFARARQSRAGSAPVFSEHGVAIRGADPVAYFQGRGPLAGTIAERVRWQGAVWLFATSANREAFERDPRRFAPRFGGYCAYTLSQGRLAPSDPAAFAIYRDRLYLLENDAKRRAWLQDPRSNIRKAEAHWPNALEPGS